MHASPLILILEGSPSFPPSLPPQISSEVLPEMYEYERALTTVANSYIRPTISTYITNLQRAVQGTEEWREGKRQGGGACTNNTFCTFDLILFSLV